MSKLLAKRRVRKLDAATVLATLRQPALVVADGTEAAAVAHIEQLVERLRLVNAQVRRCERSLKGLIAQLASAEAASGPVESAQCERRDVEILQSLPGVGLIVLAALLAEGRGALVARDDQALRALSGVAPVTRSSGKKRVVVMRRACNPRLREAVYHWSRVAVQRDPVSKAAYARLRAAGHGHGRALRCVAGLEPGIIGETRIASLRDVSDHAPSARRPRVRSTGSPRFCG